MSERLSDERLAFLAKFAPTIPGYNSALIASELLEARKELAELRKDQRVAAARIAAKIRSGE